MFVNELVALLICCGIAAFECQGSLDLEAKRKSRRSRSITTGGVLPRCCLLLMQLSRKVRWRTQPMSICSASAFPASLLTAGQIVADMNGRVGGTIRTGPGRNGRCHRPGQSQWPRRSANLVRSDYEEKTRRHDRRVSVFCSEDLSISNDGHGRHGHVHANPRRDP
jgi:hypothetical protein